MSDLLSDYYSFEMNICRLQITAQIYPSSHPQSGAGWGRFRDVMYVASLTILLISDTSSPLLGVMRSQNIIHNTQSGQTVIKKAPGSL